MLKYAKHSALFFLTVFVLYLVADGAMKGAKYYYSSIPELHVICKKNQQSLYTGQSTKAPLVQTEIPSDSKTEIILINCSTSLNILQTSNSLIFKPDRRNHIIKAKSSMLASQMFVYQEPDPPRIV